MEDSMFSSFWHFAGKQSIELDFSFTSSNLASLTIPVLLFWIIDKLNFLRHRVMKKMTRASTTHLLWWMKYQK